MATDFDCDKARRIAYKLCRNWADSEDIAQNAYVLFARGYTLNSAVKFAFRKYYSGRGKYHTVRANYEPLSGAEIAQENNSLDFAQFGSLAPLARLLASGASASDCAEILRVNRGTISRQVDKLRKIILDARNNSGAGEL